MTTSLKAIIQAVKEEIPNLWAIYLFGSHGTAWERPDSDIDIAILTENEFDSVRLWEKSGKVAAKLGKDVHLIDLRAAPTVLQNEIIRDERRIFCSNSRDCDLLENAYLSMYLHLNEERKEILEDFYGRRHH